MTQRFDTGCCSFAYVFDLFQNIPHKSILNLSRIMI